MVTLQSFRKIALSFPETNEQPHFEKTSFRIGKKIFATYDAKENLACIKLSETDQDIFSLIDKTIIYPIPNKWGKQGWTFVNLQKVPAKIFKDALSAAYCEVAPKKLSALLKL